MSAPSWHEPLWEARSVSFQSSCDGLTKQRRSCAARFDAATMAEVLAKLQEVLESAPFNMNELQTLGFRLN